MEAVALTESPKFLVLFCLIFVLFFPNSTVEETDCGFTLGFVGARLVLVAADTGIDLYRGELDSVGFVGATTYNWDASKGCRPNGFLWCGLETCPIYPDPLGLFSSFGLLV